MVSSEISTELTESVGHTKAVIMALCVTPRTWTEIKKIVRKADPTLMTHLADLQEARIVSKNSEGKYILKDIDYAQNMIDLLIRDSLIELQHLLLARAQVEQLRLNL